MHVLYDIEEKDKTFIPGSRHLWRGPNGVQVVQPAGTKPAWRAIYDDSGRIMVAMSFNSDIGDSWEWADDPQYPEKYSALGIRITVNYVVYAMTH